jgi:Tol biopolymer transport system component
VLLLSAAGVAVACLDDSPVEPNRPINAASLRLSAKVAGVGQLNAQFAIHVDVLYRTGDGSFEPLPTTPSDLSITPGQATEDTITIDLTKCLGDTTRASTSTGACLLAVELALTNEDGNRVDVQRQDVGPVRPNDQIRPSLPFILFAPVGPPASISVSLAAGALQVGQTTGATAAVLDEAGREILDAQVEWSSSDEAVITIEPASSGPLSATVVAGGVGTATIIARIGDLASVPATVTVSGSPPASVAVSVERATLVVGQTTTATAVVRDAAGETLLEESITWLSSNESVLRVTPTSEGAATATVTAIAQGEASLTGTVEVGEGTLSSPPVSLDVSDVPVPSVSVTIDATTIEVTGTTIAHAVVRDAEGNVITTEPVIWRSSVPGAAAVAPATPGALTAEVRGVSAGISIITAVLESDQRIESPTVTVEVVPARPASMVIALADSTLGIDQVTSANAVVRDARGNVLGDQTVVWTSTRPTIVSVAQEGPLGALVRGLAEGEGQIQATVGTVTSNLVPVQVELVATQLVFTQPPPATVEAAAPFSVTVAVLDSRGQRVTTYTGSLALSLSSGDPEATLGGSPNASIENGQATLTGLTVNRVANGYALVARSGQLPPGTSNPFNVTISPSRSAIAVSPSAIRTGSQQAVIEVSARDASGGPLPGLQVQIVPSSGLAITQPDSPTDANGVTRGSTTGSAASTYQLAARINGVEITQRASLELFNAVLFAADFDSADPLILAANPNGSGAEPLVTVSGSGWPRWSPDRKRLAFTRLRGDEEVLLIGSATGDTTAVVVSDSDVERPRFNPRGDRLAFICRVFFGEDQSDEVCVLPDVTGLNAFREGIGNNGGRLVPTHTNAAAPVFAWDPLNSDRLAVVLRGESDGIYSVNVNGSDSTLMLDLDAVGLINVLDLDWSPTGQQLVFAAFDSFERERIFTVTRQGVLDTITSFTEEFIRDREPVYSPDGSEILFRRTVQGSEDTGTDYFIVSSTGGQPRQITNEGNRLGFVSASSHDWSPGGGRVVLVGTDGEDRVVYVVPQNSTPATYESVRVPLSNPDIFPREPSWRP